MIRRYLRALIGAIRMTLSGKTPPASPLAAVRTWVEQTPFQVKQAILACEKTGMNTDARKMIVLTIEGRRVNLNTVLSTIKFHAESEYPILLRTPDGRSHAAIVGTNMNDSFLLGRFIATLPAGEAQNALSHLLKHLEEIPQSVS